MMKKQTLLGILVSFSLVSSAQAGEWSYEFMGKLQSLLGYSNPNSRYAYHQSRYHLPTRFSANLLLQYSFNENYQLGAYLDLAYGIDQQLKDYNHGSWGEEAYLIMDAPFGRLIGGQSYNAAYQLGISAPDSGVLGVNQSDIVNFVANPHWQRNHRGTAYRTLNSTEINTDGTAAKITYISPEFDGTMVGITYVPDSFSRDGLISPQASYKNKAGYIASIYHNREIGNVSVSGSLGLAHFSDIDDEISIGASLYYKGWTLGGGIRQTFVNHKFSDMNQIGYKRPEGFDGFRDAFAYNIGLGYEFGPFRSSLTYFYSKADEKGYEDKIIQLSGRYQLNQYMEIQAAVAHGDYDSPNKSESNQGYAFISGLVLKF